MIAVYEIDGDTVTAVAGGPLSTADMGTRVTRRAGRVEFNDATQKWDVTDATTGAFLYADGDYDAAIAWEVNYYNEQLLAALV